VTFDILTATDNVHQQPTVGCQQFSAGHHSAETELCETVAWQPLGQQHQQH